MSLCELGLQTIFTRSRSHAYFGHDDWESSAPGLKTLEDAVEIRRRVLLAFELAERDAYLKGSNRQLEFVIVGGGPTGVELAGAIADIARKALSKDFKAIDTRNAKVVLFEGTDRILGTFASDLSDSAKEQLESLGVEVRLNSFVSDIDPGKIKVGDEWIECDVVVWATGVAASPIGKLLGVETDKAGRVFVEPDLSISGHKNIFVIGDMKKVVIMPSQLIGRPRRSQGAAGFASFPLSASETFPRSVPQLRQNLPVSGFSVPHFGQNIISMQSAKLKTENVIYTI